MPDLAVRYLPSVWRFWDQAHIAEQQKDGGGVMVKAVIRVTDQASVYPNLSESTE